MKPALTPDEEIFAVIRTRLIRLNDLVAECKEWDRVGSLRSYADTTRWLIAAQIAKNENFILALTQPDA